MTEPTQPIQSSDPSDPLDADRHLAEARHLGEARRLLAAPDEPTRLRGVHALRDGPVCDGPGGDGPVCDGPGGNGALELLVETLADDGRYVPHAARAALQSLGEAAVPALVAAAADPRPVVRAGAAWVLATSEAALDPAARAVVVRLACDDDDLVRQGASAALGRPTAGFPAGEALAALEERLVDTSARVRGQAAEALASLHAAAPGTVSAVPEASEVSEAACAVLLDALDDAKPAVRLAAAESLAAWSPPRGGLVRAREALADEVSPSAQGALAVLVEVWSVEARSSDGPSASAAP